MTIGRYLLIMLAVLGLLAIVGRGEAHDVYQDRQRPDGGGSCCNDQD